MFLPAHAIVHSDQMQNIHRMITETSLRSRRSDCTSQNLEDFYDEVLHHATWRYLARMRELVACCINSVRGENPDKKAKDQLKQLNQRAKDALVKHLKRPDLRKGFAEAFTEAFDDHEVGGVNNWDWIVKQLSQNFRDTLCQFGKKLDEALFQM
eukprot:m.245657 g.245657  ORF g.245657 m.245657 type:complete len:154 (-) comp26637_c1_seq8:736-1197(-)